MDLQIEALERVRRELSRRRLRSPAEANGDGLIYGGNKVLNTILPLPSGSGRAARIRSASRRPWNSQARKACSARASRSPRSARSCKRCFKPATAICSQRPTFSRSTTKTPRSTSARQHPASKQNATPILAGLGLGGRNRSGGRTSRCRRRGGPDSDRLVKTSARR